MLTKYSLCVTEHVRDVLSLLTSSVAAGVVACVISQLLQHSSATADASKHTSTLDRSFVQTATDHTSRSQHLSNKRTAHVATRRASSPRPVWRSRLCIRHRLQGTVSSASRAHAQGYTAAVRAAVNCSTATASRAKRWKKP